MPEPENQSPDSNERRRFFRVDDRVLFRLRSPEEDDGTDTGAGRDAVRIEPFLAELDREVDAAIASLEHVAPQTSTVLHALNRKVGAVGRMVTEVGRALLQEPLRDVNLSASGMAFFHPGPMTAGDELILDLALLPEFIFFSPRARVVDCHPLKDGGYWIAADFQDLDEPERDLLVRHVFRRHSEVVRSSASET